MKERKSTFNIEDNKAIIGALQNGNETCFDIVYRHYYRALCSYSGRFVSMSSAEEIVQDTMMWVWDNRMTLIPEIPLKSLLFTIVKNKSINIVSHNRIKTRIIQELAKKYESEFDAPELYLENELIRRFTETLHKMPVEFQQTFRLHRLDGLTHKQIAEQLQISVQTVNYRIGRTIKMLRKELREYLPLLAALFMLQK